MTRKNFTSSLERAEGDNRSVASKSFANKTVHPQNSAMLPAVRLPGHRFHVTVRFALFSAIEVNRNALSTVPGKPSTPADDPDATTHHSSAAAACGGFVTNPCEKTWLLTMFENNKPQA